MVAPANIIYIKILFIYSSVIVSEISCSCKMLKHLQQVYKHLQKYKHLQALTASIHVFHVPYSSYKYLSNCKASENDHISWNFCAFNVIRSANLRTATSRRKHLAENLLLETLIPDPPIIVKNVKTILCDVLCSTLCHSSLIFLPCKNLGLKVNFKRNEWPNQFIFDKNTFIMLNCNIHSLIVFCHAKIGVTSSKFRVYSLDLA